MTKNKVFDWYTFRNETAAKIIAARCANTCWSMTRGSTSGISEAVDIADELVRILMHKENEINTLIEQYDDEKKGKTAG